MEYRMSFSEEEWDQLLKAPEMASFFISITSPGDMFGTIREMMASTNLIVEAIKRSSGNGLIDEIAGEIKVRVDQGVRTDSPLLVGDPENRKELFLKFFRDLSTLLTTKAPDDADGFKKWLFTMAQKSAEAAHEGGFLGFGGVKVNEAETAALNDLKTALGI